MIKKIILASAAIALATGMASAADLPSRVAPPVFIPPPPIGYSWTGAEFGLTTSYSFGGSQNVTTVGNDNFTAATVAAGVRPGVFSLNKSGFDTVGGGIGYNYQFTPGSGLVIGGIVDVNFFNLLKNNNFFDGAVPPNQSFFHRRLGYLGTVNGRIGYAFDRLLVYGTGGFAFGQEHTAAAFGNSAFGEDFFGSTNKTDTGYDFGGGAEYAIPADSFLNKLSVEKLLGFDKALGLNLFDSTIRAEFIHYNLGSQSVLVNGGALGSYTSRFKLEGNVVRVGLGYKFSGAAPAPVVARY